MRDSIHKYLQVGTLTWMSYPRMPQEEAIRRIACNPWFDAVEICQCRDQADREQCKKLLEQSHLTVGYGAHPTLLGNKLNPNDLDEGKRLAAEKALLEAVDEAEYLGAKGIVFLAGKYSEETKQQAYQQLLKTTKNLCAYAGAKKMTVELEIFDYDVDKASLIGPAPLAARFAADVCSVCNNFGLLVDLSHIPITHETPRFVIQTLRPFITHFHFGNAVLTPGCTAYGDKHPRFGYPNGVNDTPQLLEYLRIIKEEGFLRADTPPVFSMEVTPIGNEDPDIVVANTLRVLNRAWACLEE